MGAHGLCWQLRSGEVTQKGSGIPRLQGAWAWCQSVVKTVLCQRGDGQSVMWVSTKGRSSVREGGAWKWGVSAVLEDASAWVQ